MKPGYWVISRNVIVRAIERENWLWVIAAHIIASDYDSSRQHVRIEFRCKMFDCTADVAVLKALIQDCFSSDVAVLNICYLGKGVYVANLDTKLKPDVSLNASMRDTDLSWLGGE